MAQGIRIFHIGDEPPFGNLTAGFLEDETEPAGLANVAERSWQTVDTGRAAPETDTSRDTKADQSRLRQLFGNPYRNAVEHGGDGETVHVGGLGGGFRVTETGSKTPERDRDEIFTAGYSTADDGTGSGPRVVAQTVETHGWKIDTTGSKQGGPRLEVTGVGKQ